jgi:hypothetical protein
MGNKTHYVFRVSKDPCDDSAEYLKAGNQWTHTKSEALLMTEEEANDFTFSHSSDDTVLGAATDTDDHHLL